MIRLNETLSWIRSSYLLYQIPAFRSVGEKIGPAAYFKWVQLVAEAAYHIYPPDRRRAYYMRRVLAAGFPGSEIPALIKKNIRNRKWQFALIHAWEQWKARHQDWIRVKGEDHLARSLCDGEGAVLLSGHAHGFSHMVAPVLSDKGYKYNRVVRVRRNDPRRRLRRGASGEILSYITLGQDVWQHMRALQQMRFATKNNELLHLVIRGLPSGRPEHEIEFFYKKFFLDPKTLQILEILQAPVHPCFALSDDSGRLLIEIHPALAPSTSEIVRGFGRLYSNHLSDRPESAHFWRRMVQQKEYW